MPREKIKDSQKRLPVSYSLTARTKANIKRLAGEKGKTASQFIESKFKPKKP